MYNRAKIYALIPARAGSKRVKDKNIRELSGVPLMVYSIRAAAHCKAIQRIFVSTDSLSYSELARKKGGQPIIRPPELAEDDVTDYPVIEHFLDEIATLPDYLVYLRPTTPLRKVPVMDAAIKEFVDLCTNCEKSDYADSPTAMRSVEEMSESAFKCYTMLGQLLRSIGDPDVPNHKAIKTYKPNGYIDIIRPKMMLATGNLWGSRVYGFKTPPTIEIDTEHEFKLAEYQIAYEEGERFVFTH
jgi:CMP-N-acetylneuraminic acid synthetase